MCVSLRKNLFQSIISSLFIFDDCEVELPFEISIFEYSFVNHVQSDIRIWNLEIRMCHEIRILQLDSNVSQYSNIPTRFEYHARFEYSNQIRMYHISNIKILWPPEPPRHHVLYFPFASINTEKKVVFIFLIYLMKIVHFFINEDKRKVFNI